MVQDCKNLDTEARCTVQARTQDEGEATTVPHGCRNGRP